MIYTKENLELMGDVYCDLKQLKSYKDHAPLQCDIFPFKNNVNNKECEGLNRESKS